MVELGIGCISIGRPWGVSQSPVPQEKNVLEFLDFAFEQGLTFFDTAPAYGFSEQRLGKWLKALTPADRAKITVATKFGEFWNFETEKPYRSYDFQSLKDSIDQSYDLLGEIDIFQLHGTNLENIGLPDVLKAFEYANSLGTKQIGVSISDPAALNPAIESAQFQVIQLPHNQTNPNDREAIVEALAKGKLVIINRPFAMGKIAQDATFETRVRAYQFILEDLSSGIILTGTSKIEHLKENLEAFSEAQNRTKK